jgi:hypothetical protein
MYPRNPTEITGLLEFKVIEKFPSKSVVVPLFVPFSITVAPGKGTDDPSVTTPVIVCATRKFVNIKTTRNSSFFE